MRRQAFVSWSGGKDSAFALYRAMLADEYEIRYLLTSFNSIKKRVPLHTTRRELVEAQAVAIGLPLISVDLPEDPSMEEYEKLMREQLTMIRDAGCTTAIYGDIFIQGLRDYREERIKAGGGDCAFPLWKNNTSALLQEFIDTGFKAVVVSVNSAFLDKSFCGSIIDDYFIKNLPADVDSCGENGEFYSFVFDGPIFKKPVNFTCGKIRHQQYQVSRWNNVDDATNKYGAWFCDLIPA